MLNIIIFIIILYDHCWFGRRFCCSWALSTAALARSAVSLMTSDAYSNTALPSVPTARSRPSSALLILRSPPTSSRSSPVTVRRMSLTVDCSLCMVSSTTFLAAATVRPLVSCSRPSVLSPDCSFFSAVRDPPPTSDTCLVVAGWRRLSTDAAFPAADPAPSSVSDACCLTLSITPVTRSISDGDGDVPSPPTTALLTPPPPSSSSLPLADDVHVAF